MDIQNMRKLFNVLMLVLIAFTCASCHKELDVKDPVVSNDEMTVSGAQARFSWCVDFGGQFQTGVELSPNENMTELRRVEAKKDGDKYVAVVDGLLMGTKYYYRIVVWNKLNNYVQEMKSFSTSTAYTVTLACNPQEGGTAMGDGTYVVGDTCTVTASANAGYNFVNWTENGNQISAEAEYRFAVTGNRSLLANFTSQEYTITATAEPEEGGTVNGFGGYNNGDECTLTATANEGYSFINWTKDGMVVSTNPVYSFTVTETAAYVAHFQVYSYTITVASNSVEGGFVEGGGIYEYGQSCTVIATEANGYHFVNWTENGEQVSSEEEYTFTVTGNRDLVANFTFQQYTITVSAITTDGGSVTGGGAYYEGEQCTVTALPADGYTFMIWYEMVSGPGGGGGEAVSIDASYTFTVNRDRTLEAHFTSQQYTITVSASPTDGGSVTGGGTYYEGEQCTVTATANTGYAFTEWCEIIGDSTGGIEVSVSSDADYTFTVNSDRSLVAKFIAQPQAPEGAINGLFTINEDGVQVYFSQGNLQYIGSASTPYWKFADNQWDVLGTTTGQNSSNQAVDRDLFGWGTSGYNHGAVCYQPWRTSTNNSDYHAYGYHLYNLYAQTGQADWGYNPISNGGNHTKQWHTLTQQEWNYVFNTRSTTSGIRYAKALVNDVKGVILLPDNWSSDTYNLSNTNNSGASYSSNTITPSQWSTLEQHGAVFLPAAGNRYGTSLYYVGSSGFYWSASYFNSSSACDVYFNDSYLSADYSDNRFIGQSVRLVCPVEK